MLESNLIGVVPLDIGNPVPARNLRRIHTLCIKTTIEHASHIHNLALGFLDSIILLRKHRELSSQLYLSVRWYLILITIQGVGV